MDKLEVLAKASYDFIDSHRYAVAYGVTAMVGALTLRRWLQGGVCRSKVQLNGKTVLITGANTGIGKETARDIAGREPHTLWGLHVRVYAYGTSVTEISCQETIDCLEKSKACRDLTRGETAATEIRKSTGNGNVVVYKLDLASLKSVRSCAEEVKAKEQRLDILINNAGVMWTPYWKTEDGFEMQFGTNHLGHFLFTNLLLDMLKVSAPSRIINVSSLFHSLGTGRINFDDINSEKSYNAVRAYAQSKLANVLFTRELARRLKGTNVTTYALHPGVVDTELFRFQEEFSFPIRMFLKGLHYGLTKHFIKTSVAGAQTSIYCAVEPGIENLSGKYFRKRYMDYHRSNLDFSDCREKAAAPQGQDDEAAARLWTVSEEMVGVKPYKNENLGYEMPCYK